jgi:hypothetical protein
MAAEKNWAFVEQLAASIEKALHVDDAWTSPISGRGLIES